MRIVFFYCLLILSNQLKAQSEYELIGQHTIQKLYLAKKGLKYGYLDFEKNEVTPFIFENLDSYFFNDGLAYAKYRGKYGFITMEGMSSINFKYDSARSFSNGFAPVMLGNKWGYVSVSGREIIPFKFDAANPFNMGRAPVKVDLKWGYIDSSGNWVVKPIYDYAGPFYEGLADVRKDSKKFKIDRDGIEINTTAKTGQPPKTPQPSNTSQSKTYEFSDELSVLTYLQGKTFQSSNGTELKIDMSSEVNSYGIIINGKAQAFNLTYTPITRYKAVVEGDDFTGGRIKIYVNSVLNTLENGGTTYSFK